MNKLLAAILVAIVTTAAGCSCGAFNGADDRVYARGSDALILCENDGFVADVASGTIEGKYVTNPDGTITMHRGDDPESSYAVTFQPDGTLMTTNLGDGAWNEMTLNKVELDHADVRCTDLANRAWWSTL
jgi:hypothetical protein